jgi:hypothetical protein
MSSMLHSKTELLSWQPYRSHCTSGRIILISSGNFDNTVPCPRLWNLRTWLTDWLTN